MKKSQLNKKSALKTDYKFIHYSESQSFLSDLNELISHNELTLLNAKCFVSQMKFFKEAPTKFNFLSDKKKTSVIRRLMNQLEVTDASVRINAARSILFIMQGCLDGPILQQRTNYNAKTNTMLVYSLGIFPLFINLLNMERKLKKYNRYATFRAGAEADYENLYVILNVLYLIVEHMQIEKKSSRPEYQKDVEDFVSDVLCCEEKDSLFFILLEMMTSFALMSKPGYPIKKIMLLIWKIVMISFGSLKNLSIEKRRKRLEAGLDIMHSNNLDISGSTGSCPLLHKVSKKDLDGYSCGLSLKRQQIDSNVADESMDSLKKHLYIPLSDLQIKYTDFPRNDKIDTLYKNLLPNLLLYIHCILLIFHSCNDQVVLNVCRDRDSDCLNIFGEISSSSESLNKLEKSHIYEHAEIINKATSALLLLLLKHFKLNHIYQFEFLCQTMVSCNALLFLATYIKRTGDVFGKVMKSPLITKKDFDDFPICTPSSRNLFTCVNVLRITNKLVKWKYSRTERFMQIGAKYLFSLAMLNNNHLSIYSLKLLKLVSKLLGRKWRQENMRIMNQIFQKVRHRLLDDWSSGISNNNEDEDILQKRLDLFNRQYQDIPVEDFGVETCKVSTEITEEFKNNYEEWLEREVFQNSFDWDSLLQPGFLIVNL